MSTPVTAAQVKELRDRTDAPMMECRNALVESGGDIEQAIKILKERGKTKAAKRADRETQQGLVAIKIGEGGRGGAAVLVSCETDFAAKNEKFQHLLATCLEKAWQLPEGCSDVTALLALPADGGTVADLVTNFVATVGENLAVKKVVRLGGIVGGYRHHDGRTCAIVQADGDAAKSADLSPTLKDIALHVVANDPIPLAVDRTGISEAAIEAEKEIFVKRAAESGKPAAIIEKMIAGQVDKFLKDRALLEQPYCLDNEITVGKLLDGAAKAAGTTAKVVRFERFQIGG